MSPAKKVQRKRRRSMAARPEDIVQKGVIKWVAWSAGILVTAAAVWTAWVQLGLPKVATYDYVDEHITRTIAPIASKVDQQGVLILNGRLEALRGNKQQQEDAKARLELQSKTSKDPLALQLIGQQQKNIDDTIKGIDDQIARLSAQVQRLQ